MARQSDLLSKELRKFAEEIREFESNFNATINQLESNNMSKEVIDHLKNKKMTEIVKQLRGLEQFISTETLSYANRVTKQLISMGNQARG